MTDIYDPNVPQLPSRQHWPEPTPQSPAPQQKPPKSKKAKTPKQKRQDLIFGMIIVVLVGVFCVSGWVLFWHWWDDFKMPAAPSLPSFEVIDIPQERYENGPRPTPFNLAPMDNAELRALMAENPDIIAIVDIPNTVIRYPIVQTDNNDYYLTHNHLKEKNGNGAIFMDYRNDRNFMDQNTVIYGHHRSSGLMFNDLDKFVKKDFAEANRLVNIILPDRVLQATTFAVCIFEADADYRYPHYPPGPEWDDFMARIESHGLVDLPLLPLPGQRILSLTTCNYMDKKRFKSARLALFCIIDDRYYPADWEYSPVRDDIVQDMTPREGIRPVVDENITMPPVSQ